MKVDQSKVDAAIACFKYNPLLQVAHVTSDLECFGDRSHAVIHARTLEDKSVDVFNRGEENEATTDVLDSFRETKEANIIPDAKLANKKHNGGAKGKAFANIEKPLPKDTAPVYGTEKAKPAAPKKPAAEKKPAAPKKPAATKAPKVVTPPVVPVVPESTPKPDTQE